MGDLVMSSYGVGDMTACQVHMKEKTMSAGTQLHMKEKTMKEKTMSASNICERKSSPTGRKSTPGDNFVSIRNAVQLPALHISIASPLKPLFAANETINVVLPCHLLIKYKQCAYSYSKIGFLFIPLALDSFKGICRDFGETHKRIDILAGNRTLQPSELSRSFHNTYQYFH